jgi:hypothetical protein
MNIKLKGVRLSFPYLFKAHAFSEDQEASFSAVFLLDKKRDATQIKTIKQAMTDLLSEAYPKGQPKGFKLCLRDGSEKSEVDGYGDEVMFIGAKSKKRVPVVDTDPSVPLTEDEGRPYAGCYVNASIRIWVQDNKWGKRVNAALRAVQFLKDGDPFGEKPADAEEEFKKEDSESDML